MASNDEKAPESTSEDAAKPTSAASIDVPADADVDEPEGEVEPPKRKRQARGEGPRPNNVRRIRIEKMLSKAELARRANVSVLTIDRVEKGFGCRVDTKRKILEALGLSLADRVRVFGEEE
jgi:DNA-binding XRE family transcriptional regulator